MASRAVTELSYPKSEEGVGPRWERTVFGSEALLFSMPLPENRREASAYLGAARPIGSRCSNPWGFASVARGYFAADRGYNSKETIAFLSETLGASWIGTHKRDMWYLFVFGDGPISRH